MGPDGVEPLTKLIHVVWLHLDEKIIQSHVFFDAQLRKRYMAGKQYLMEADSSSRENQEIFKTIFNE